MLWFEPLTFLNENHSFDTELFQGRYWQRVTSKIDFVNNKNNCWIYLKGNYIQTAEKLFFDSNSPKMVALKKKALQCCQGKAIYAVLENVNEIINQITDQPNLTREQVEQKLDTQLSNFNIRKQENLSPDERPCITMDEYIDSKILVCRQKALIAAALLAYLVEQGVLPMGKVRTYRTLMSMFPDACHAWATYRDCTSGKLWICDPRWQVAQNITDDYLALIEKNYGCNELDDMRTRLDTLDILNPIVEKLLSLGAKIPFLKVSVEVGFFELYISIVFNNNLTSMNCLALSTALSKQDIVCGLIYQEDKAYLSLFQHVNSRLHKLDCNRLYRDYEAILNTQYFYSNIETCENFIEGMNRYCFESIDHFDYSLYTGTIEAKDMHVKINLNPENAHINSALARVLEKHGVYFEKYDNPQSCFIIPVSAIGEVDFEQLYLDYWGFVNEFNECDDYQYERYRIW